MENHTRVNALKWSGGKCNKSEWFSRNCCTLMASAEKTLRALEIKNLKVDFGGFPLVFMTFKYLIISL